LGVWGKRGLLLGGEIESAVPRLREKKGFGCSKVAGERGGGKKKRSHCVHPKEKKRSVVYLGAKKKERGADQLRLREKRKYAATTLTLFFYQGKKEKGA